MRKRLRKYSKKRMRGGYSIFSKEGINSLSDSLLKNIDLLRERFNKFLSGFGEKKMKRVSVRPQRKSLFTKKILKTETPSSSFGRSVSKVRSSPNKIRNVSNERQISKQSQLKLGKRTDTVRKSRVQSGTQKRTVRKERLQQGEQLKGEDQKPKTTRGQTLRLRSGSSRELRSLA